MNAFCPTHYSLCCIKCSIGKSAPHNRCPVVPFGDGENIRTVYNNLSSDLALLAGKVEVLAERMPTAIASKEESINKNAAAVKTEIETVFNRIRDALKARENDLINEVEKTYKSVSTLGFTGEVSSMKEEVQKAITVGQEALKLKDEPWEMVRRGCAVREVLGRATRLEKTTTKALSSVPEIEFEYDEEINDITKFVKVVCCQKSGTGNGNTQKKVVSEWPIYRPVTQIF